MSSNKLSFLIAYAICLVPPIPSIFNINAYKCCFLKNKLINGKLFIFHTEILWKYADKRSVYVLIYLYISRYFKGVPIVHLLKKVINIIWFVLFDLLRVILNTIDIIKVEKTKNNPYVWSKKKDLATKKDQEKKNFCHFM